MVRALIVACLLFTLSGAAARAGEFADTMEGELIFLPEDGSAAAGESGLFTVPDGLAPDGAVVTDAIPLPDGTFISEPYVLVDTPGPADLAEGMYDRLPRFFGEMNKYDQIAMEPYKDTYDSMDLKHKAEVYAQQFEYMNDRKPRFSPNLLDEISATSEDAFAAKRYLYRPPVIKQPKEEPKPIDLGALSGPWAKDEPAPEPEPAQPAGPVLNERGEAIEYYYDSDGSLFVPADRRMETLRGDWDELWQRRQQTMETERAARPATEQPAPRRQIAGQRPIGGRLGGVGGLGGAGEVTAVP